MISFFSGSLWAEQKIVQGNYEVHYSVFPSTAISPDIAAQYQLTRSEYRALINITPQIKTDEGTKGVKVKLNGQAQNLIGNTTQLQFKEITEGSVVYYLAEFGFSNEEHFRFKLEMTPEDSKTTIPLRFEKKFYRE